MYVYKFKGGKYSLLGNAKEAASRPPDVSSRRETLNAGQERERLGAPAPSTEGD